MKIIHCILSPKMTNKNKITGNELLRATRKVFAEECKKRSAEYSRSESEDIKILEPILKDGGPKSIYYEYRYSDTDSTIEAAHYNGVDIFDEVRKYESFFIEIKKLPTIGTYSINFLRDQVKYHFRELNKGKLKECMQQVLKDPINKLNYKQEYGELIRGGYRNQNGDIIDMKSTVDGISNHVVLDTFSFTIGDPLRNDLLGFDYSSMDHIIHWTINEVLAEINNEGNACKILGVENKVTSWVKGETANFETFKIVLHFKKQQ